MPSTEHSQHRTIFRGHTRPDGSVAARDGLRWYMHLVARFEGAVFWAATAFCDVAPKIAELCQIAAVRLAEAVDRMSEDWGTRTAGLSRLVLLSSQPLPLRI